ncbi:glycosyl hydrolase family 28-related protein [Nocardia beijingensis]|uniref:glycosyl hydrolase family 28-related protein n=1 Tax=Nocardia beijingensis TaxID=95162 RepID=UPI0033A18F27
MSDDILRRRRLLAATLGAAAVLPIAAACTTAESDDPQFRSPTTDAPAARNVRDFGAVGDGIADDTKAFAAAVAKDPDGPLVLYVPAGHYRVESIPDLPDYATILGDGADVTTIVYAGDGTLVRLRKRSRVRFARLGIYTTGPGSTAVELSECFRCSFDAVVLRGNHLSDNHPRYLSQRGVVLRDNTGGTAFINCDINNFGIGLTTSCIQNYVTSSKFTSNHTGVLGTGNDHNAGLALTNVEFVSDQNPLTTDRHLRVDGAANDWWLTNVWFEGADVAVSVGDNGRGGPAQFGMVNAKVAARSVGLELNYCRQPYLANVIFDAESQPPGIPVRVNPAGCPEGTAVGLISGITDDLPAEAFPAGWTVIGRKGMRTPRFTGTVVSQAGPHGADVFQAQSSDGAVRAAVAADGTWVCEHADNGPVLKAPDGGYWRLTVSDDGKLGTVALGRKRPGG